VGMKAFGCDAIDGVGRCLISYQTRMCPPGMPIPSEHAPSRLPTFTSPSVGMLAHPIDRRVVCSSAAESCNTGLASQHLNMTSDMAHNPAGVPGERGGRDRTTLTPEEFAARLKEHHRIVWTIAASILNSPDEAEDVVQEAAAIALTKLDTFNPDSSFPAWFGQFVRYVSLNEARKRLRARRRQEKQGTELVPAVEESSRVEEFDRRILCALESLPEVARACLLLRTLHDLPFTAIARALDIPEGTAMSHVHRARVYLRERLASLNEGGKEAGS
jgi:RNA polymerase sigma-70 factor (ECF subfamily)